MKKKVLKRLMAAVCTVCLMAGCGAGAASDGENVQGTQAASGENYQIGISQFAEHGSLDNCREG